MAKWIQGNLRSQVHGKRSRSRVLKVLDCPTHPPLRDVLEEAPAEGLKLA